ncbi:MAG TPA: SpoIIE family protein phosphatase [Gaiellaceae bacterium]|nr:SpoIIE family protein phosphatase [Gaiellaceae bacterium]
MDSSKPERGVRTLPVPPNLRPSARGLLAAVAGPSLVTIAGVLAGLEGKQGIAALFLAAVVVATFAGGLLAGLLAAAVSALSYSYVFIEPEHSFDLTSDGRLVVAVSTVGFVVAAVIVDQVMERQRELQQRLERELEQRRRREDGLAFLTDAGAELSSSLDYRRTLGRVGRLAVPRLADGSVIDVVQDDRTLHQVAVVHVDAAKARLVEELEERYPSDTRVASSPIGRLLREGTSVLVPEVTPAWLSGMARDADHLADLRRLGLRSLMAVPLVVRGRVLGALTFLAGVESGRLYGPTDLRLAEGLARQAALAIDNARLFGQRSEVARTLQRALLPPALPGIPNVEVAARYRAAGAGMEIGGDFYDVFEIGAGRWAVAVGDVCGKGPEAAAVTGLARHTLRAVALEPREPSDVLALLNDAIRSDPTDVGFCTVAYGNLTPGPNGVRLSLCLAGHPPPLVRRADGSIVPAGRPGTMLGVLEEPNLENDDLHLAPGDAVAFYTDGLIERAEGDVLETEARLAETLAAGADETAHVLVDRIDEAFGVTEADLTRDDIALLVIRVSGPGAGL